MASYTQQIQNIQDYYNSDIMDSNIQEDIINIKKYLKYDINYEIEVRNNYFKYINSLRDNEEPVDVDYYEPYIEDYNLLKIGLFNIYDDNEILSSKYGSTKSIYETMVSYLYKYYKFIPDHYIFSFINEDDIFNILYIKKLNDFFDNPYKYFGFFNLGTKTHATMLYLSKLENNLIKVVYINTGYGTDTSEVNDNEYYNLFKTIYIRNDMKDSFINFLRPFLFFKTIRKMDNVPILYYYVVIKSAIHSDKPIFYGSPGMTLNDWFSEMYKICSDDEYSYKYMNMIFNTYKIEFDQDETLIITNHKTDTSKKYNLFNYYWNDGYDRYIQSINDIYIKSNDPKEKHHINYLKKAYNNIKFKIHGDYLLFELQKTGTCLFKSFLLSIIYHNICYIHPFNYLYFYSEFSSYCFYNLYKCCTLSVLPECYLNQTLNTAIIINYLIKDNILDKSVSYNNYLYNSLNDFNLPGYNIEYNVINYEGNLYTKPFLHLIVYIPFNIINEVHHRLRNKSNPETIVIDIHKLCTQYYKKKRIEYS